MKRISGATVTPQSRPARPASARNSSSTSTPRAARQPAPRPLQPALLRDTVVDFAAVDLADEHALAAGLRVGMRRQLLVQPAQPGDQLGAGGDDVGLAGRPHDLVDRRLLAADRRLPGRGAAADDGQTVAQRLGQQHRVADAAVRDQAVELLAEPPRRLVQVVGRQQHARRRSAPASRSTRSASTAAAVPPFMSEAPLPVSRPPSTAGGTNGRWTVSRWPLNCSVRPGRPLSRRTTTAGAAGWPAAGPFDREAVGRQDLGEAVDDGAGLAGAAGDGDELHGGVEQPSPIDGGAQAGTERRKGVHDREL